MSSATSFYDFKPLSTSGTPFPLAELKGNVVLVVNTASNCGFTPQFDGLEKLYQDMRKAHGDKFTILGFPCNQFASQDPEPNDKIVQFCRSKYGVTFPMLAKVLVNGDEAEPLWKWLRTEKPGVFGVKMIKWNFEKFLVGADGEVKGRWASTTKPEAEGFRKAIEDELRKVEKPVA